MFSKMPLHENADWKSQVFRPALNCSRPMWMFLRCDGSSFQVVGAETRKLRGPNPAVLVRGTIKSRRSAERSRARAATVSTGAHTSRKYAGDWPRIQSKVISDAILYLMCWCTGSQWSVSRRAGVMWSCRRKSVISRVEALSTVWRHVGPRA